MQKPTIAPSILSADFSQLGAQVRSAALAGAKYIHIDVMDGHFVPNLTIGPLVTAALKPLAQEMGLILDVHLMIEKPERLIPDFAKAGADILTVHVEACPHLHRTLQQIRELGVKPGVALNPATMLFAVAPVMSMVDYLLVMSVNPGFGGQSYIPESTARVRLLRQMLTELNSTADLSVDGGVKVDNVKLIADAGANVLVAGSAVFNAQASVAENMAQFWQALASK
jgi:ribulose-phosphate 3-epimerase